MITMGANTHQKHQLAGARVLGHADHRIRLANAFINTKSCAGKSSEDAREDKDEQDLEHGQLVQVRRPLTHTKL